MWAVGVAALLMMQEGKAEPWQGWPLLLQPLKLKGIAFFRQKSNSVEATTAVLSGVNTCFQGFETATLYLPCLLWLLTAMDILRVRSSYLTTKLLGSSIVDCLKVREKIVLPRMTTAACKFSRSLVLAQLEIKLLRLLVPEVGSLPQITFAVWLI